MKTNETIKVIELRNYLVKPGVRDRFIEYFEKHFVESQNAEGGFVLGAFRIDGEAERFFWIRGFADMASRSRFLPAFYYGDVWKAAGPEANEMMLEWHHVYLLRPLGEIRTEDFLTAKGLTVVDFYEADENKFAELIDWLQTAGAENSTLWVSETAENDFPRLPVIQDENPVVAISGYKNETEYANRKSNVPAWAVKKTTLVLYPTAKFSMEK